MAKLNSVYGWNDCPDPVRQPIEALVSCLATTLSTNLLGIYLHGSLALGCFNPQGSDLDLLIVTSEQVSLSAKRSLALELLARSQDPFPIELSICMHRQLVPWSFPTPFDFHYSEMWRAPYTRQLTDGTWTTWNDREQSDPDLAAHITVLNARGICLLGMPITAVLPSVPVSDYRASIGNDIRDALENIISNPVYAVLNCCRTYAYLCENRIFSKAEGGHWALQILPGHLHGIVADALAVYQSVREDIHLDSDTLARFTTYMQEYLIPLLSE